jgi:glycosyltransferase involved in cell wall biosynthesis
LISLAVELRKRGIDAHFGGDTVRPGENLAGQLAEAGVFWERELRLSRKVRIADVLHDARLLRSWTRAGRFDVLHAAFAHDHSLALWAKRRGVLVVRAAQRRVDVEAAALRLLALRKSDGVVVHARSYRERLLRDLPEERVAYVPPSVDGARFTPGASELRRKWGIPSDVPLAGIVARMKPERGHRQLLRAFAVALRRVPEARLVLVGRGEDEEALRALAPPQVIFAGYTRGSELTEAYRALDVAVWLREGNDGGCRGVLEAMACSVPVIAGSEGASGELVRDGVDGVVVDAQSEESIASALSALLGNPGRARSLGASGRERALTFTPARAASETLAFWERLRLRA